jgi:Protein of unknown function (DUF1566)
MHITHRTTGIVMSIVISVLLTSAISVLAGTLDATTVPSATSSYTLEDIYNRLDNGTAGTTSSFTEPIAGPVSGTKHTLSEIMAKAPAVDDVNGAAVGDVLLGKTFWGRTSNGWGPLTGISGSGGSAPVPRTGQTICYNAAGGVISCDGTGQDGTTLKGVAWPSPRFTNNNNGTVTDNLTGLIWLLKANVLGTTSAGAGAVSWAAALTYVVELNTSGMMNSFSAGDTSNTGNTHQTDWRLPNLRELQSLIDYSKYNPALPAPRPFTGIQPYDSYWSSTTAEGSPGSAWSLSMSYGLISYDGKAGGTGSVWPVRGGQS